MLMFIMHEYFAQHYVLIDINSDSKGAAVDIKTVTKEGKCMEQESISNYKWQSSRDI